MRILRMLAVSALMSFGGGAHAVVDTDGTPSSLLVGVGTHLFRNGQPVDRTLDAAVDAGFSVIRDDSSWGRAELERGNIKIPEDWDRIVNGAVQRKLSVLLILGYGNKLYDDGGRPVSREAIAAFSRYAQTVAKHFRGRVTMYEIWNEWDHESSDKVQSPESYMALVKQVYPAVKQADPDATVLAGAITSEGLTSGYLDRLVTLGVMNSSDGISIHTYVHCRRDASPDVWASFVQKIESGLISRVGKEVPLYVTEVGWPTFTGKCGITEATQREYFARTFSLAEHMPYLKGLWWYDLQDDGIDPANREHHFGLLRQDFSEQPAFQMAKGAH